MIRPLHLALSLLVGACGSNRGAGGPRSLAAAARMAPVVTPGASFAIDRVPVTERDFARFLEETGRVEAPAETDALDGIDPARVLAHDRTRSSVLARYGSHPAVLVTWNSASAYCAWRALRLPSEAEWELAMGGVRRSAFPWGNWVDPTRINSSEFGPGDTTPVLTHPRAASSFGVHDGAGNAAEWTSTLTDAPDRAIIRGSGWHEPAAMARLDRRRDLPRDARSAALTFRCARTIQ